MRTVPIRLPILLAVCFYGLSIFAGWRVQAQQSCPATLALKIPTAANIFSIEQERALGDIEGEEVESAYHQIHDDGLEAHLNGVAGRVFAKFQGNLTRVRVLLIDTPEADTFSVGPDRIYITRKMVALLRNDDELAGLLGHELGHIQMHQNAIVVSQLFHEVLGVDAVSDRKDIEVKFRQMLGSIDQDRKKLRKAVLIIERQEAIHQYAADRFALYVSAAAGFSPKAFVELFDRSAGTNGSTGSFLTDFFGVTSSDERRLSEIKKSLKRLPPACREIAPSDSAEFRTWQAAVISYPDMAQR